MCSVYEPDNQRFNALNDFCVWCGNYQSNVIDLTERVGLYYLNCDRFRLDHENKSLLMLLNCFRKLLCIMVGSSLLSNFIPSSLNW